MYDRAHYINSVKSSLQYLWMGSVCLQIVISSVCTIILLRYELIYRYCVSFSVVSYIYLLKEQQRHLNTFDNFQYYFSFIYVTCFHCPDFKHQKNCNVWLFIPILQSQIKTQNSLYFQSNCRECSSSRDL